jgi:hypothetical protein
LTGALRTEYIPVAVMIKINKLTLSELRHLKAVIGQFLIITHCAGLS